MRQCGKLPQPGRLSLNTEVFQAIKAGTVGKGDVLGVAATAANYGCEADVGSDSDVPYPADYKLQSKF